MATPRVTRARTKSQEPLPAVGARTSEAYGAKGKANLSSQLESSGDDFATAFGATRREEHSEDANHSEDGQDTIAISESPKKRGRPPKAKAAPDLSAVEEEEDSAEVSAPGLSTIANTTLGGRPDTSIGIEQNYFVRDRAIRPLSALRDHGLDRPNKPKTPRRARADVHVDQRNIASGEPLTFRVFIRALPRYIQRLLHSANSEWAFKVKDLFLALLSLFFLVTIFAWVPLPDSMTTVNHYRENFFWGLKHTFRISPYDVPPSELEAHWHSYKHDKILSKMLPGVNLPDHQWALNINFLERLEKVEVKMAALQKDMTLQSETMDLLRETLPSSVILRVIDGRYEIPEDFWKALQERIVTNSEQAPLWKAYVERNEAQLVEVLQQRSRQSLSHAIEEKHLVYREELLQAIRENNDWLANEYRDQFQKMQDRALNNIKRIATDAAHGEIQKFPISMYATEQIERLAKMNQVHNTYESLHGRNWFSVGLGARINPHLTSQTQEVYNKTWYQSIFPFFSPKGLKPNPPIAALVRWEEATDCWCAASDPSGKAQIAIITPVRIIPDRLVIEHIPALATLNIAAAPRIVEVWALVDSAREADLATAAIGQSADCGPKPSPESVCIARGTYDIHGHNHVQTIPVFVDAQATGLGVNRFLVRVTANWGGENTCLYRLRMTGEAA